MGILVQQGKVQVVHVSTAAGRCSRACSFDRTAGAQTKPMQVRRCSGLL